MKFKKEIIKVSSPPVIRRNLSGITACIFKGTQFGNDYNMVAYHPVSQDIIEDIRQWDEIEVNGFDKIIDNKVIHIINSFKLK